MNKLIETAEILDAPDVDAIELPPPPVDADEETFRRLAALSISEYERTRKAEAEKLGWRVTVLDELVANRRPAICCRQPSQLQGQTLNLPDAEPWLVPVNGAEMLDQIAHTFSQYVALPDGTGGCACAVGWARARLSCVSLLATTSRYIPRKRCEKLPCGMCSRHRSPVRYLPKLERRCHISRDREIQADHVG